MRFVKVQAVPSPILSVGWAEIEDVGVNLPDVKPFLPSVLPEGSTPQRHGT